MKLTSLTIARQNPWVPTSDQNPLRAVVKLEGKESTVECVLSDESMRLMLDLCSAEVVANAERNVREFCAAVTAIDADKSAVMIGG